MKVKKKFKYNKEECRENIIFYMYFVEASLLAVCCWATPIIFFAFFAQKTLTIYVVMKMKFVLEIMTEKDVVKFSLIALHSLFLEYPTNFYSHLCFIIVAEIFRKSHSSLVSLFFILLVWHRIVNLYQEPGSASIDPDLIEKEMSSFFVSLTDFITQFHFCPDFFSWKRGFCFSFV